MRTQDLLRNPSKWLITVLAFLDFLAKGSVSASIALSKYHKIQKFFVQAANTIEKLSSKLKAAEAGRKEAEAARDEAVTGRKEAEAARDEAV
ncbi:MAG: hypothetical protein LBT86_00490, partial [Deltaproteobacteria bacterium]|nr:hypothetical protein [Deltaproteobacteria bacterium]